MIMIAVWFDSDCYIVFDINRERCLKVYVVRYEEERDDDLNILCY